MIEGGDGRNDQGVAGETCSQRITFETLPSPTPRASHKPSDTWCENPHHTTEWSAATTEATGPLLVQFMFCGFSIWGNSHDRTEQKASTGTVCIPVETLSLSKAVVLKVWVPGPAVWAASGKWLEMQILEPHPWATESDTLDLYSEPYKYYAPSQSETHSFRRVLESLGSLALSRFLFWNL